MADDDIIWRDGDRTIRFGKGALGRSPAILAEAGWHTYELLSTSRALADAHEALSGEASRVHEVAPGKVADVSAAIIDQVTTPTLVALGGGRVIDAAKAIAAVRGGRVAAIPTTLSGAEMTRLHRLPAGHEAPHNVRPALVLADPGPMTDLDDAPLRATAMNALAHGAEALYGPVANPVATMAGLRGIELIAKALDERKAQRDRTALALGALLCAYAIDNAGLGLHHAVCQELVRITGIPHAQTNALMLPRTIEAMRDREPKAIKALAKALGVPMKGLAERLEGLSRARTTLSALGADRSRLEAALDAIHGRLRGMPDSPDPQELRELVEGAW